MKVLVVSRYKANIATHVVAFVAEQYAALREVGCDVELFLLKGNYWQQFCALRQKIRDFCPDVIHAHYGLSCLLANLATRRVPVVSTYHGSDINLPKVRPLSKLAVRLSAWNIFVSKLNMALVGAVEGRKCSLIPCGVALSEDQLQTRAEARKALGWKPSDKKVLFAGAFDNKVKQPELALQAIDDLNREENRENNNKNIEHKLDLTKKDESELTDSSSNNLDLKSAQKQAFGHPSAQSCSVSQVDSSEKICQKSSKKIIELIELKGYTREEVNRLMCACNCLLMTSKTEGSPQVIKEAMACGCPIVSVDVGDVKERVAGVDGCYVVTMKELRVKSEEIRDKSEEIRDKSEEVRVKELVEALKEAMAFEEKTRGRERILRDGLTNEQVAQRLMEIYERVKR